MNYNISVREFLQQSRNGSIDYDDFLLSLQRELEGVQKKFDVFQRISPSLGIEKQNPSLYRLPVSAKDCICVKGLQSSAGSQILQGYVPPFDATAVARVKEKGGL